MIEVSVDSVRINMATEQRVVILKAIGQDRYIFIWIAQPEAYAIAVHLREEANSQGTNPPRPLTHDLMKDLVEATGAKVIRIDISDFSDDIYYAHVVLDVAGKEVAVDARPSDAIALAIRAKAPMFVAEQVFERVSVGLETADSDDNASTSPADPKKETQSDTEEMQKDSDEEIQD